MKLPHGPGCHAGCTTWSPLRLICLGLLVAAWSVSACDREAEPTDAPAAEATREDEAATAGEEAESQAGEPEAEADVAPKLGPGTKAQRALLTRAKSAFLSDDLTEAERLFKELTTTGPVSGPQVSAYVALGQIYTETDRAKEAVALYDQLNTKVEDIPEVQLVVARALAAQGEATRAIKTYEALLASKPDFAFAQLELAALYKQAGRSEEMAKAYYAYEQKIYGLAEALEADQTPAEERLRILDIFSFTADDRAVRATMHVMRRPSPQVREKAAHVLADVGATEAIPLLEKVVAEDPEPRVKTAARMAIERLEASDAPDPGVVGPTFVDDPKALPEADK